MSEQLVNTPKIPAIDLYMDKVRAFVRKNRGHGQIIDVMTLLAALLQEKEVQDFIARQTDIPEILVRNIATVAEIHAENFIQLTMTRGSVPASESGEIGFYHNLDAINAGPHFVNRCRAGEFAPQNMVEIFVALATAPELAFTTKEDPHPSHSVHKALEELVLGKFLQDKLLEIEYGTKDPDEIFRATPPREPTGRAIALVRSGASIDEALAEEKTQKTPLALTMDRAAQPATPDEATPPDAGREQVKLILSILSDPEAVAELLGTPAGRAAIEEFAQKLASFDPGAPQPPGEKPPKPGHG